MDNYQQIQEIQKAKDRLKSWLLDIFNPIKLLKTLVKSTLISFGIILFLFILYIGLGLILLLFKQ